MHRPDQSNSQLLRLAARLLSALDDLETFIADHAVRRRAQREKVDTMLEVLEHECTDEAHNEALGSLADRLGMTVAVARHSFESLKREGLIEMVVTPVTPSEARQRIENIARDEIDRGLGKRAAMMDRAQLEDEWIRLSGRVCDECATPYFSRYMPVVRRMLEQWLADDLRPIRPGSRRTEVGKRWIDRSVQTVERKIRRQAAVIFHFALRDAEEEDRGPAYADPGSRQMINEGPIARALRVWSLLDLWPARALETPRIESPSRRDIWEDLLLLLSEELRSACDDASTIEGAPTNETLIVQHLAAIAELRWLDLHQFDQEAADIHSDVKGMIFPYLLSLELNSEAGEAVHRRALATSRLIESIQKQLWSAAQAEAMPLPAGTPSGESAEAPRSDEIRNRRPRADRSQCEEKAWGEVAQFSKRNGRAPTVRELAELVGCSQGMAASLEAYRAGQRTAAGCADERRELLDDLVGHERAHERAHERSRKN